MSRINIYYQRPDGVMSTPNSPKAKSAPATPCNVTPTAFHQSKSHIDSMLHPSPANTLPLDISKHTIIGRHNISSNCQTALPSQAPELQTHSLTSTSHLDQLIEQADNLLESENYDEAIRYYTKFIDQTNDSRYLDYLKKNFMVFGRRAEAHLKVGNYDEAIEDSRAARKLNSKWAHAYYQQGKAQFLMGKFFDAMAAFSFGIALDPSNKLSFEGLVDAALKCSPDTGFEFESKYHKLETLGLSIKPFIVLAVLGQELLARGHVQHAIVVLESALKIDFDNKKLRGSVLSAVSHAHYCLGEYEKAVNYMKKEYEIENELEDVQGQCRILSNIGYTYFRMGKFEDSLNHHRLQAQLAMPNHLFPCVSRALNALGHVHAARNDYNNALTSHTRCLEIVRQLGEDFVLFKEILSVGHINVLMGDLKAAEERYDEASRQLVRVHKKDHYYTGYAMLRFNQTYLAFKQHSFSQAKCFYHELLGAIRQLKPASKRELYETRANLLGQLLSSADFTKPLQNQLDGSRSNLKMLPNP